MAFTPRTVDEIQQAFFAALAQANSRLVDIAPGSFVYTISRAHAAVVADLEQKFLDVTEGSFIPTSTGEDLTSIGTSYNLPRLASTPSQGTVLAISFEGDFTVPEGSTLTHLDSGQQYITTQTVAINDFAETPIAVIAAINGSNGNLAAGTPLYSDDFQDVDFVVGFSHPSSGEYCGNLTGGRDSESDTEYRLRLGDNIIASGSSSTVAIENKLLEYPGVNRAFVRTRVPGVVEIWVDVFEGFTPAQQLQVQEFIKPFLGAGIIAMISEVTRKPIDVSIAVTPFTNADLQDLTEQIGALARNVFNQLEAGDSFVPSTVQTAIAPLAVSVTISNPTENVTALPDELITWQNILVTYPS